MIGYPKPPKTTRKSRVEVWNKIRQNVLKPLFEDREITYCEITRYEFEQGNITEKQAKERNYALSFAHRHKRDWYKQFSREIEEKMLGSFNQVLLLGQYYHNLIESDAELTEHYFQILRGSSDDE